MGVPPAALLCLVTDRRALALEQGGGVDPVRVLTDQVAAAVDAGVDLVHVRERDLEAGRLRDVVGECVRLAAGSATTVVVNDRVDVALAAGAGGVHLRGDSAPAARWRTMLPAGFRLGQSVRHAGEAAAARDLDYVVLGTIFPTPSKPGGDTIVGLDELSRGVRAACVPVLAIGGITEERLAAVSRTGAAGVAAIRLFFCPAGQWHQLPARVRRWRRLFDTGRVIS